MSKKRYKPKQENVIKVQLYLQKLKEDGDRDKHVRK